MKLDPLIERERRASSPETKAMVSQVDDLIKGLEARKEKMLYEPTREIDARISALREKKQTLLSGEVDEDSAKTVPAPPTIRLPIDLTTSKDPVKNPFDAVDVLPSEESELRPILKQALEFGMEHVNKTIADFRPMAGKYQNTPVSYSQGEHLALRAALAMMWVETRQLFKFAREKRQKLEDQAVTNAGWFNELFRRVQALEKTQGTPFVYEGVFDPTKSYHAGNFVTFEGSLWHCQCPSKGIVPGKGNPNYQLAVKHGRDLRDGKAGAK